MQIISKVGKLNMTTPANKRANDKQYVMAYDILNIISMIAVVILHVNNAVWWMPVNQPSWKGCLAIEVLFYWAVPVFFMLTGTNLIDYRKRYSTKVFLKKRFDKTVIPFLFWSIISIPWGIFQEHSINGQDINSVRNIIDVVFHAKAMSIYWFFLPLFTIYLCIPLISLIPEAERKKACQYYIVYSFLMSSLFPPLCTILGIQFNNNLFCGLNGAGGMLMFAIIGYYLTHYEIRHSKILFAAGAVVIVIRYMLNYNLALEQGSMDHTYSNYNDFYSVLLAVAVFIFFVQIDFERIPFFSQHQGLIRRISGASFGIYLTHYYLLRFLVTQFGIDMTTLSWHIWGTIAVYCISLVLVLILQRIPLINKIVP